MFILLVFLRPKLPKVSQRTEPTRGVRVINPAGSLGRHSYVTAASCMVISIICGVQATPSTLLPNCGVSCNYIHKHNYICISSDNNDNHRSSHYIVTPVENSIYHSSIENLGFPFPRGSGHSLTYRQGGNAGMAWAPWHLKPWF
jgi:hypothetical protein